MLKILNFLYGKFPPVHLLTHHFSETYRQVALVHPLIITGFGELAAVAHRFSFGDCYNECPDLLALFLEFNLSPS